MATVTELWRYPVKSLQGVRTDAVTVGRDGVVGDRTWAFADARTGAVLSAKREPLLLTMAAQWDGEAVLICIPGERQPRAGRDAERAVSDRLGRAVVLAPAPAEGIAHVDLAPLHLLAQADLDALAREAPNLALSTRRFRPNLVVDELRMGELDAAVGDRVTAGPVAMDVFKRAKRCAMVSAQQPGLAKDSHVLRALARGRELCFGIYASVVTPGPLRVGDEVTVPVVGLGPRT